jgi:hypothetical protein
VHACRVHSPPLRATDSNPYLSSSLPLPPPLLTFPAPCSPPCPRRGTLLRWWRRIRQSKVSRPPSSRTRMRAAKANRSRMRRDVRMRMRWRGEGIGSSRMCVESRWRCVIRSASNRRNFSTSRRDRCEQREMRHCWDRRVGDCCHYCYRRRCPCAFDTPCRRIDAARSRLKEIQRRRRSSSCASHLLRAAGIRRCVRSRAVVCDVSSSLRAWLLAGRRVHSGLVASVSVFHSLTSTHSTTSQPTIRSMSKLA